MNNSTLLFGQNGAQFAVDILQQFGSVTNFQQNFVFSPFSIQCCMALAFAGSSGETAKELVKGLRLVSSVPEDVALSFQTVLKHFDECKLLKIGNKIYLNENHKLKSQYEDVVKEKYMSEAENINFAQNVVAANKINLWISERTAGKIKDLICADALSSMTGLVLLNAIHFKGQWETKFPENATREDEFWFEPNKSVKMYFMHQKAKFYITQHEELKCTILEMPYKDSDLSILVLLPVERDGLKELVQNLSKINLLDLTKDMYKEEIIVKFPKFKVDFKLELKETFKKIGINQMFGTEASFDNMLETACNISVSEIVHKAVIEVNEEGTEAAAATGMVMMMRCLMNPFEFNADHPFLYFIWNRTNILFTGAFVNVPEN